MEDDRIMLQKIIRKQIQEMQGKADVISALQRKLKQDIQAFKLDHPQDRSNKGDMVNIGTRNLVPRTAAAAPDHIVHRKL